MKIAIFGGTFNPIHNGHLNIVKSIKQKFSLDYVYIVPTNKTPSKFFFPEKIKPKNRFEIVKKTIEGEKLEWLKVSDFELRNKGISYTYKTIEFFKKKFPNDKLYFVLGDDRYVDFQNWKNPEYIKQNAQLIVLKRSFENNYDFKDKDIIYFQDVVFDISSSSILKNHDWENIPLIAKKEIAKKRLYLKALNYYMVKDCGLLEHELSVATHARRLARRNFMFGKIKKAYWAGLLHDMFKCTNITWQINYIYRNSDYDLPANPALHGITCALWLKNEYMLNDPIIESAIEKHTIAAEKMSKFDKLIYVADKIANDRKDIHSKRYRRLAYINLSKTFNLILVNQINKLKLKKLEIDNNTLKAYEKYVLKKKDKNGNFKKIK